MRVAVMGAHDGHVNGMIANALQAPNVEMVGIVEPDDAHYARVSRRVELPRFPSLEAMIDEARPQLILEGLNHAEKTHLVTTAARHGIHLLLDKPLCRTLTDWSLMREAVVASGIKLSMWFTSRSYAPFVRLREYIEQGALGDLVSFVSTHPHKLGPSSPAWYYDPAVYTGVFHDLACHGVDQIRWLAGAEFTGVSALSSSVREHPGPLADHVQASFSLANGSAAVVTADWLTPQGSPSFGDTRFIIMGTKGSAHLRAYAGNHVLIVSDTFGTIEPTFDDVRPRPFVEEMVRHIERGEEHFISTDDVFAVAKACLVAEESARQGGRLLPIDSTSHGPALG